MSREGLPSLPGPKKIFVKPLDKCVFMMYNEGTKKKGTD